MGRSKQWMYRLLFVNVCEAHVCERTGKVREIETQRVRSKAEILNGDAIF